MKRLPLLFVCLVLLVGCKNDAPEVSDEGNPGAIRVIVFEDENHDQGRDPDEQGIATQVSIVQNDACPAEGAGGERFEVETSLEGEVLLENLTPGNYCVSYQGKFPPTTKTHSLVNLHSNEEVIIFFGVNLD